MNNLFHKKYIPFAIGGSWLLWVFVHAYILNQWEFDVKVSVGDSLVNNTLLAVSCCAMISGLRFYRPGSSSYFMLFLWIIVLAKAYAIISNYILSSYFKYDSAYLSFLEKSATLRIAIGFLVISCAALMRYLFTMLNEQKENQHRKTDAENLLKEAELTGLRQQLQPHFLFNSLNSISALAGTKPEEARKMIQQLSDFLRGTLKKDGNMVPLKEELSHLQLYLEIEKVRFGHRLEVEIISTDESLTKLIPPLLLQPIVENAVKFGLYDTIGKITIQLKAEFQNNELIISITNPFDSETSKPRQGTGFGLESVRRRLFLLFSRNDLLKTDPQQNIFITTIIIPQNL